MWDCGTTLSPAYSRLQDIPREDEPAQWRQMIIGTASRMRPSVSSKSRVIVSQGAENVWTFAIPSMPAGDMISADSQSLT